MGDSPGTRLRQAMQVERPLQVVGTINAYAAKLAERAGFRAIYLSGAGVANASFGLPDLGMTTLANVVEDAARITAATELPLLVDCDTGWGSTRSIQATVREMNRCGVAAIHLEDQVDAKRCGHRDGKQLVSTSTMLDRLKAALDAREDADLMIVARTDAVAVEGLDAALQRAGRYAEIGADVIFAEALNDAASYRRFADSLSVPILANMTEFGRSPLLSVDELAAAGVGLVLYPLTAFRAMAAAAQRVFRSLRETGSQVGVLEMLQSRQELYDVLDYETFERRVDQEFGRDTPQAPESKS